MRVSSVSWQKILSEGFRTSNELLRFLELPEESETFETSFKVRVPRHFASLMKPKDPNDPLLLQVLATDKEQIESQGYLNDPLYEANVNPVKGLLHKYHGRVLITLTGACAVHCRYCFRRHFPYEENNPGKAGWEEAFHYIREHASIHEVILSGGDPLVASQAMLVFFMEALESIPHVKTIRFHTRVPVVLPERIDDDFLALLKKTRLHKVMVFHCNHPNEISSEFQKKVALLRDVGTHLLNQTVLLNHVNDDEYILADLSHRLFESGILPYYLHLLDRVNGVAHFEIPDSEAKALYARLQSLLPGYLVPKLVREESEKPHKTLIF